MSDFISDDEMARIEKKPSSDFISDDDMNALESSGPSVAESGLRGAAQGATLGFADEIAGGTEALWDKAIRGDKRALHDLYTGRRDESRSAFDKAKEANPGSYLGGELAGGVASLFVPGGAIGRGASLAGRAGLLAAQGAAAGVGHSAPKAGEDYWKQLAVDGAVGGAAGAGLGLAGEALIGAASSRAAPALRSMGSKLQGMGERAAFKSLGPNAGDVAKAASRDEINKVGRTLLDKGVLKGAPSYEKVGERAAALADQSGNEIDRLLSHISDEGERLAKAGLEMPVTNGAELPPVQFGIDRKAMSDAIRSEVISPHTSVPGIRARNDKFSGMLEEFDGGGDRYIPIKENEALKRAFGDEINWERPKGADAPSEEKFYRAAFDKLRQGTEDAADAVGNALGDGSGEAFRKAKSDYGDLSKAAVISGKKQSRELANRFISPSDHFVGAITASAKGGPSTPEGIISGITGAIVNKVARNYGNPQVAKSLDLVSKAFPKLAKAAEGNPKLLESLAARVSNRIGGMAPESLPPRSLSPDLLRKFSDNPELIDTLKDEALKDRVRKEVDRSRNPATAPLIDQQSAADAHVRGN